MKKLGEIFALLNSYRIFRLIRKKSSIDTILLRLYNLLIKLRGKSIVIDLGQYQLELDPNDQTITKTFLLYGGYEEEAKRYIIDQLPFDILYDVGANIGDWTVNLKINKPQIHVFSFEPHPGVFKILKNNCEINGLNDIKLFNIGIGPTAGEMNLYCNPNNLGDNSLIAPKENWTNFKVNIEPLTKYINSDQNKDSLLKLDVQGFEYRIIKSLNPNWLDKVSILLELDLNYNDEELIDWILTEINRGRRVDILRKSGIEINVRFEHIVNTLKIDSFFDILLWKY
jgi:FkbM family methyltransferase